MSDPDESFDILRDIKPQSFEPLTKNVTDSINCKELAPVNLYVDPEQQPVPLTSVPRSTTRVGDWYVFVCVGISLIGKSTHSA